MLNVRNIRRSFGSIEAVRNVSFDLQRGQTLGLLGPNGAGKTTIMRMLLGIYAPDSGSVTWNGAPIDESIRKRLGYLPEERGIYGRLRVAEQIVYFGRLHGLRASDATTNARRWMSMLDIEVYANRPCSELSKGNQQKVGLACSAVHEPELLILDEPFSGLDPVNAQTVLAAINGLRRAGTTLVLSSHQMWQIEDTCDRFCIISGGEVRAYGTLAELRAGVPERVVRVAPDLPQVHAILERFGRCEADGPGSEVSCRVPAGADFALLLRELVATAPVTHFEPVPPSLASIYLRAIGSSTDAASLP
jgi:ABC-2 type transport system ATP-binding protein